MPNLDTDATQDPPNKYDHSDHPTTHARVEDEVPPSNAKQDDQVEERAGRRYVPDVAREAGAGPADGDDAGSVRVRRVDGGGGGAR